MKKTDSIFKMQSLGLNTLDCFITKDFSVAKTYLRAMGCTLMSMRTERGYEFLCPFYYMQTAQNLIDVAKQCINAGYTVMIYPGLPKDNICFGTVALPKDGTIVVEWVEGAGLLRELDTHPRKKHMLFLPGTMQFLTPMMTPCYREINEVILEVREKCYDEPPCIIEWSYFHRKVGMLNKNQIFWEIRSYE